MNEREAERLRQAFRERVADAAADDACVDPGRIWSAVTGEATIEELDAATAHASRCGACADAWSLAADLARSLGDSALVGAPDSGASWTRWATSLAAAVLTAALVVPWFVDRDRVPEDAYRARPGVTIETAVAADAVLPRDRFELSWSVPGDAEFEFDVVVATEEAAVVHRAYRVRSTSYRVPASALEDLPDGARVVWHVRAVATDGSRIAPLTWTTVVGPRPSDSAEPP